MADSPQAVEKSILQLLSERMQIAITILGKPEVNAGQLIFWNAPVINQLEKIYGKKSPLLSSFPRVLTAQHKADPRAELIRRTEHLSRMIETLERAPGAIKSALLGNKIFIGHGRSLVWLQLKDFIRERFKFLCDEFNLEPAAGISTTGRLETMLSEAGFAFVVMTAEEKHENGLIYARPNVIHESGLFQGKLGTRRAIILLEEGCSDFSNIAGLTQIRFPKGDLRPAFEDVRGVFEREGLVPN